MEPYGTPSNTYGNASDMNASPHVAASGMNEHLGLPINVMRSLF